MSKDLKLFILNCRDWERDFIKDWIKTMEYVKTYIYDYINEHKKMWESEDVYWDIDMDKIQKFIQTLHL